jgi:NAD-dependent oxidoreductase involved in siderophore biosynthesis
MTAFSTLRLEPVTEDDIQALSSLWYAAFTDPGFRKLFPDTPAVRQWWDDANRADLRKKPFQKYLKVVDTASKNKIIAYAKWDLSTAEQRGERFPPFPAEGDQELLEKFFGTMENERKRVLGDRLNYCMYLYRYLHDMT